MRAVHSTSFSFISSSLLPRRLFHSTRPLLSDVKSDHNLPWIVGTPPPKGFWDSKSNQKKYLDHIYKSHQFTSLDDWYKIKKSDFTGASGKSFLAHFENSPTDAIVSIYGGKHLFHPWKFSSVPTEFWQDGNNQRQYVEWLGKSLGYSSMQDWYKAGVDDFLKNGGRGLLQCYNNSIQNCLEFVFPEHDWLSWKFQKLPTGYWDDVNNVRQFLNWMAADLKLSSLDDWLRVDGETLKKYEVVRVMAKYGTLRKLLTIAYPEHSWTQKPKPKPPPPSSSSSPSSPSSFPSPVSHTPTASISSPTLTPNSSINPFQDTKSSTPSEPTATSNELPNLDVDVETSNFVYTWSESKFILETKWDSSQDPTNWWMLMNPGGMRVMWESKPKKFYTQTGGVLTPPPEFAALLPRNVNLDGTLTCVEGKVHHCVNTHIRTHVGDWSGVTFNIFDAPTSKTTPLEERMALIEGLNLVPSENVTIVGLERIESMKHLLDKARELSRFGTDSILLRAPNSQYENGRSKSYQRALIYSLQPAVVTSVAGPFIVRCNFPDGTDFALSHSLPEQPLVGSVLMVKFNKINEEGQPRNATVTPWPEPLNWSQIVGKKCSYNIMLGDKQCI
eukprot:Phypoly_transcript_04329.p1 GENE.Phypoly_transcript_04329~~Phypoly_transcript_04329.p1  ORF type:complete len:614 (+),score=69.49 Phypoly_transcript_04329:131-1972(+)